MPSLNPDQLYRNLSASSVRDSNAFETFLEKVSNRFFFADRAESRQLALSHFNYRIYQDRSGIGLMTHIRADGHRISLEWQTQEMRDDAVYFLYVLQGEITLPSADSATHLPRDSFVVLDARKHLTLETTERVEYVFYLLPYDYFQTHAGFRSGRSFGVPFCCSSEIRRLFSRVFREIQKSLPKLTNDEAENLSDGIFVLLRSVLQPYFQSEPVLRAEKRASLLEQAQSVLNSHIDDTSVTLEFIACEVGVSARHLSMLYAQEGSTVMLRLKEMRLKRASIMLREKHLMDHSIGEIARFCGFKTQAHFSREFKRFFGVVPSDYRARNVLNRSDL
jgi:AraC-like DNA-binding protein